jgi:hypothetical protein
MMYNLEELFPRYKITYDLGVMQIPCQKGIIYMHDHNTFALECKTYTARLIMALNSNPVDSSHNDSSPVGLSVMNQGSGVRVHQEGDSEWTLLFGLDMFDKIADIVQPRKRKILSEEQKAAAIERLKKYQFK